MGAVEKQILYDVEKELVGMQGRQGLSSSTIPR
jgi:hypothetical protein